MATTLDSLLVALGYEFDDDELKEFNESVDATVDTMESLVVAAAAVSAAFIAMVVSSAAGTDQLAKQSREIGIATEELDALNFAAEQTIGNSDGVAESLRQLSIRASEAARGTGSAVEALGILGVSATDVNGNVKDVNVLLAESADALSNIGNEAQRVELADKLGIAPLNLLLQEGSAGIAKLTAEARRLGVVTAEDAKAAEDFNDQWNRIVRVTTTATREIATGILPVMTELVQEFQEWFKVNEDIIKSGINKFLEALAVVLRNIQFILIAILSLKFVFWIIRVAVALQKLGMAALLFQLRLFAIVAAIGAVIAAIGLLIQDFIVFKNGGDSAIGRLLERFPKLTGAIRNIRQVMDAARNGLADFFVGMDNVLAKIPATINFVQGKITNFFNFMIRGLTHIKDLFAEIGRFVGGSVDSVTDAIAGASSFVSGKVIDSVLASSPFSASSNLLGAQGLHNTVSSQNRNVQIGRVELNVNGGDLDKVRNVVMDVFTGQIQQASSNAQSPVAN